MKARKANCRRIGAVQAAIFHHLSNNAELTTIDLTKLINCSLYSVNRALLSLLDLGVVKRCSKSLNGQKWRYYYTVVNDVNSVNIYNNRSISKGNKKTLARSIGYYDAFYWHLDKYFY